MFTVKKGGWTWMPKIYHVSAFTRWPWVFKINIYAIRREFEGKGEKLKFIGHLKLKFDLWLIVDWQTLDTMLVL